MTAWFLRHIVQWLLLVSDLKTQGMDPCIMYETQQYNNIPHTASTIGDSTNTYNISANNILRLYNYNNKKKLFQCSLPHHFYDRPWCVTRDSPMLGPAHKNQFGPVDDEECKCTVSSSIIIQPCSGDHINNITIQYTILWRIFSKKKWKSLYKRLPHGT